MEESGYGLIWGPTLAFVQWMELNYKKPTSHSQSQNWTQGLEYEVDVVNYLFI